MAQCAALRGRIAIAMLLRILVAGLSFAAKPTIMVRSKRDCAKELMIQ